MPSTRAEARTVGFGLGSNIGDGPGHVRAAATCLMEEGIVTAPRLSSIYRAAPWGDAAQDDFANACMVAETLLAPLDLLAACKRIETALGRRPTRRWGPRVIDIDLLFYGDVECQTPALTLPHRHLFERAFVLVPLAEIIPDLVLQGRRIADAAAALETADVVPWRAEAAAGEG